MAKLLTPAGRVRQHRPKIVRAPEPPDADRRGAVRGLTLNVAGRELAIGANVEGDPQTQAQMDGTATITVAVRDVDMALVDALADEQVLLTGGVRCTVNGDVYVLQSLRVDGTLVALTLEDEVSWRLKQFHQFLKQDRAEGNRAHFVLRLVREASSPPLTPMPFFCPEIDDRQQIAAGHQPRPATAGQVGGAAKAGALNRVFPGHTLADAAGHVRLSPGQVMAIAEAVGFKRGDAVHMTEIAKGESSFYPGIVETPEASGAQGFGLTQITTQVNGEQFERVVDSLGGWGQMLNPVKNLIAAKWLFDRGGFGHWHATQFVGTLKGLTPTDLGGVTIDLTEPFEYTRGSRHGRREDSWQAIGRLARDVNWHCWAQHNTLFFVSDDELRASPPAVEIDGNESWLVEPPSFEWAPGRPVTEVTLRVLADRWGVQVGACVLLDTPGVQGRFLVRQVAGSMVAPELEVTLDRPAPARLEPANTTREASGVTVGGNVALVGAVTGTDGYRRLLAACAQIDAQNYPYVYGGGHGRLGVPSGGPPAGYDCSGAVSAVLATAGLLGGSTPLTSTGFESWGAPGEGREFTVWTNATHVFIQLSEQAGSYWRFGTSPHETTTGPGPHLRHTKRSTAGFVARHARGH